MKGFSVEAYEAKVSCETEPNDAVLTAAVRGDSLTLSLTAEKSFPTFVTLRWRFESPAGVRVVGDAWERSYGNLAFCALKDNDRWMPWYFMADDGETRFCFGVKTQPNTFVSFRYDETGVTALVDCRNGGCGVRLGGRTAELCTFVLRRYEGADAFACLCDYCKALCDAPLLPGEMVYGGNNWYYAYGKSSFESLKADVALQAELAEGLPVRPFMVADDGWQQNRCAGPWLPNKKHPDMKALADRMKAMGVQPGLWMRPLYSEDPAVPDAWKLLRDGKREYLDPTVPEARALIRADITRIKGWGYRLLKHDFSTVDLFGSYGKDLGATITNQADWHFFDRSRTNAEIVLDFYRLIKDACGDMLILGCNTVSHLCAGLVHLNRTGDDTSGYEWARTRDMGINTLAFRLAQNNAFYLVDADCVGILKKHIPWEKNRQWLDLLARSGTALFVSCDKADAEKKRDLKAAYRLALQPHDLRPLDWKDTPIPAHWLADGEEIVYHW